MRIKYFVFSLLLSFPFWWGVNVFANKTENAFFSYLNENPKVFKADISSTIKAPERKFNLGNLEINAKAAASVLVFPDGKESFLYKKNIGEPLPIASLSKLMAANVVFENFDVSQEVKIKKTISLDGAEKKLKKGESFFLIDLVSAALVESNNSAAQAVSEIIGEDAFVDLMNLEAKYLGMTETNFVNPTGLDPDEKQLALWQNKNYINRADIKDLLKLSEHIIKNQDIIKNISKEQFDLYTSSGKFHHTVLTTNEFLKNGISFGALQFVGAKTGQTIKAKGCLILILKNPENNNYLISIVLGSDDRFGDMRKMIDWASANFNL